jgi:hypothetical protein
LMISTALCNWSTEKDSLHQISLEHRSKHNVQSCNEWNRFWLFSSLSRSMLKSRRVRKRARQSRSSLKMHPFRLMELEN